MIKSLFTTAFRNLVKNKFISGINIFGLSIGVSAFLLLFLYVYNEETFDQDHVKHQRIYRLMENNMEYTKGLVVPYLLENYPEIENGTRILDWSLHQLEYEGQKSRETIVYVDTGFFDVFTFKFIEGNPEQALKGKYGIVLTEKLAQKLFGREPAINKTISLNFNKHNLTVTGIVEDPPANSSVQFTALSNYDTGFELDEWLVQGHDWYNTFSQSYLLLNENVDPASLESKLVPFVEKHFETGDREKPALKLLPLADLHDHTTDKASFTYLLICIALGIVIIASINFVNLFTVASGKRIKEIGMRKTMGASQNQVVALFFGESMLVSLLSVLAGIFLTMLILPYYNQMFDSRLILNFIENPLTIGVVLVLWILTGVISGFLPALKISRLHIISSLKGKSDNYKHKLSFGNGMAVFQFTIAIFLIIGTLVIKKQITYMKNHELNFDVEQVLIIRTNLWDYPDQEIAKQKIKRIMDELKFDSRINAVTSSSQVPGTYIENYNTFYTNGWSSEESIKLRQVDIGSNYFNTYGINFIEGDHSREEFLNDSNAVVLNAAALKELGAENATGNLIHASSKTGEPFKIVGVVEDFHYQGLHREIQPLIHYYKPYVAEKPEYITVRFNPGSLSATLDILKEKWQEIPPSKELEYFFADDEINKQYNFVVQASSLAIYFSFLAIIISCLGLLAMTIFMINKRIKEIGIRKVVGASVTNIVNMLTLQNIKWIVISIFIAAPVAYYAMDKWLQSFAHKTEMNWWIFILGGGIALMIAIFTIGYQTIKAALVNPVETLRDE